MLPYFFGSEMLCICAKMALTAQQLMSDFLSLSVHKGLSSGHNVVLTVCPEKQPQKSESQDMAKLLLKYTINTKKT
jgi:hypothetical protein